jgi:hypothetical protein
MKILRIGDLVRLQDGFPGSADEFATVVQVSGREVRLSNLDEPFRGTLSGVWVDSNRVELVR